MRPRDTADLMLAPVALQIDAKIQALSGMTPEKLTYHLALELDRSPRTKEQRAKDIVDAVTHLVDMSGWTAAWDPRGVRLSHGPHTLVLGVSTEVAQYVQRG